MKFRFPITPIAIAITLGLGSAVSAQTTGGSSAAGTAMTAKEAKLPRADRKFIEDSATHGMFELQAGQLAATKASDPAVKAFAEQLVKDQSSANQDLEQMASKHQVTLPTELPRSMRNKLADMQKKSGAEFDREFVQEVGVKAREEDMKRFQKASRDSETPELKAWVDKMMPTMQQHLATAQKLPGAETTRMGAPPRSSGAGTSSY